MDKFKLKLDDYKTLNQNWNPFLSFSSFDKVNYVLESVCQQKAKHWQTGVPFLDKTNQQPQTHVVHWWHIVQNIKTK